MKAILVIDMPERCWDCPYGHDKWDGEFKCLLDMKTKNNVSSDERSQECPLKPMPKEKNGSPHNPVGNAVWESGWNACLKEIEK